jgi:nucleoside-diphosphate-sugar epimerase
LRILVLGAKGDVGRVVVAHLRSVGHTPVIVRRPAPTLQPFLLSISGSRFDWTRSPGRVLALVSTIDAVINCSGITLPAADQPHLVRTVHMTNVVLPALLSAAGDTLGTPILHLSSAMLGPSRHHATSAPLSAEEPMSIYGAAPGRALLNRILRGCKQPSTETTYVFSKRLMESVVESSSSSVAVRLSCVYGPGLMSNRLVPRIIRARLDGAHITLADEARNYFFGPELGCFLTACVERAFDLPSRVIDADGATNTTIRAIAAEVERALPTCYGHAEVHDMATAPRHSRSMATYFPDLNCPTVALRDGIRSTTRSWRRARASAPAYSVTGSSKPHKQNRPRLVGGSITRKQLVTGPSSSQSVEKHSSAKGYEGSGSPKLQAENAFYEWLKRSAPSDLCALFPPTLPATDTNQRSVTTEFLCGGLTLADALISGDSPFPTAPMREAVTQLFTHSYFTQLVSLPDTERVSYLNALYLDRPGDRLFRFLSQARRSRTAPTAVRTLSKTILEGEQLAVDGHEIDSPLAVIDALGRLPQAYLCALAPSHLGPCGHGDLTILNMLWRRGEPQIRLIDPRGVVGNWDPVYDLGKLLFSLSGFALIMRDKVRWMSSAADGHTLAVADQELLRRCAAATQATRSWITTDPTFASLHADTDPTRLGLRLRIAEASHFLADVPYRYAQGRDWNAAMAALLLGARGLSSLASEVLR